MNNFWRQFTSDCHQTSSVIPLATGDEVIKFWTVKVGGEVCALLNALLVLPVLSRFKILRLVKSVAF